MATAILVVDDEGDIRSLVSGVLSDNGIESREAWDSSTTFAELHKRVPSLILLDIRGLGLYPVGHLYRPLFSNVSYSIESAAHKVEVAKCFGVIMTIKNNSKYEDNIIKATNIIEIYLENLFQLGWGRSLGK